MLIRLKECRDDIERIDESIKSISKALNLAGNEVRLKILSLLYKESDVLKFPGIFAK